MAKEKFIGCTIKSLPPAMIIPAAAMARDINPANSPLIQSFAAPEGETGYERAIMEPMKIALLHSKYWGPKGVHLTVGFMEDTKQPLVDKILESMNYWNRTANILFSYTKDLSNAQVRISRGRGGYWSYLGTDILSIPANQPTMNLEGFSLRTPDSEYERVVTHETFHTCGGPHEHMRPDLVALLDRQKTISYFRRTQGWSSTEVVQQVLTPLSEKSEYSTPVDQDSIMCYQIPGECTKNGKPIRGGVRPNPTDLVFAAKMYPKALGEVGPNVVLSPVPESMPRRRSYLIESDSPISFKEQE